MKKFFAKAWQSPTIMTWMSYSTRALSLFIVLPLILKKFVPGDIVLWYLFSTIIALQAIADFGFRSTFSRLISYAYGGADTIAIRYTEGGKNIVDGAAPNLHLLSKIVSAMKTIYRYLTLSVFLLLLTFGTWSMTYPVSNSSNIETSWISWIIVLLVSCISFYAKIYLNFLEGLYQIALVRRVETLTSLATIMTSILVLIFSPTLLNLVIANQFWVLVVSLRDWILCNRVDERIYTRLTNTGKLEKTFFKEIWAPAWRTGISGLMSSGLTNVTGIIYAQLGQTGEVASYLLAIRIINQVRDISMAPFYSKLPLLAMLRVQNKMAELIKLVKKGMFLSHMVYVLAFAAIGLAINPFLHYIHSDVQFVSQGLWLLMGCAFFIHRFGAMHIQIYLSTNHIISHIADGISGIIYIISSLLLVRVIGVYSIPVSMLIGYLGFYAWYAASYSYKSIGLTFWNFEKQTSLLPISIMGVYVLIIIFQKY